MEHALLKNKNEPIPISPHVKALLRVVGQFRSSKPLLAADIAKTVQQLKRNSKEIKVLDGTTFESLKGQLADLYLTQRR